MIGENALVAYKNKPAITREFSGGKISISLQDGSAVKVRDKDIELLHPGPVKGFGFTEEAKKLNLDAVREAWELLSGESAGFSLKELAALVGGEYSPVSAYAAYCAVCDGLYFTGNAAAITARSRDEVSSEEEKRSSKQKEASGRSEFLQRIKNCLKKQIESRLPADDLRFMQDVEALAYGKSAKSRTMKELGLSETPEDAHSLLLKTGIWTVMQNPHPARFGLPLTSAKISPPPPPAEDRRDLCRLPAFAIDNAWSDDPDDAVSIENAEAGKSVLYVHVADPASSVSFDSPAEKEARDRGATLYLPEGAVRMLAEDAVTIFALGLSVKSPALTFKMTIDESGEITETEIFPSTVKVRRLTYEEADKEMENPSLPDSAALCAIYELAERFAKRRSVQGAVFIELPDVHITLDEGVVKIEPVKEYRSNLLVRECMIAAGEGAGLWAAERGIAFPYISQEVEIQGKVEKGLTGFYHLRRSMRPRVLSAKPGRHQGLGLDTYTQVTSPLRRYNDLLSHIQIRSFLRGGKTLGTDEISARLGFCEAATVAANSAERASDNHWKMVYLSGKKDSEWEAVALENKGSRWLAVIPSLALEIQVPLHREVSPNDSVKLILKSVNIPKGEAVFVQKS